MRLTYHSSQRQAGKTARHNDRNFDVTKAENVDSTRTNQNIVTTCYGKDVPFEDAEKRFYEEHYKAYQEDIAARAMRARHPDQVKTMDQILHGTKTHPTEDIVQIGAKDDCPPVEDLKKVTADFIRWHEKTFPQCRILDIAWHLDETTPHAHIRRAWIGHKNGIAYPCMEKALAEMGIERPDLSKPEGRHNCRSMTYTKACREKLLDLCRERGLSIEEQPRERSQSGLSLIEYKARQEEQKAREAEARAAEAEKTAAQARAEAEETRRQLDSARAQLQEANRRLEAAKAEADKARRDADSLAKAAAQARAETDTLAQAAAEREKQIADLKKEVAALKRERGIIDTSRPAKTTVQESRLHPGMVLIGKEELADLRGRAGIGDALDSRAAKLAHKSAVLKDRENTIQERESALSVQEKLSAAREQAEKSDPFRAWVKSKHPDILQEFEKMQTHTRSMSR